MNPTPKRLSLAAIGLAILGGLTLAAHAATVTWTDADVNDSNWSTNGNWNSGTAPTAGDAPLFTNIDAGGTSHLDGGNWTVNGLLVRNPETADAAANISHTLDLNGNRLQVLGNLGVAHYTLYHLGNRATSTWTVTNGTLQIGDSTTSRALTVGQGLNYALTGNLTMGAGSTFDAYLSTVVVGSGEGGKGVVDLRLADVKRGVESGVFRTNSLQMGLGGHGNTPRYNNEILFGNSLSSLEVVSSLTIADGHRTSAWIGQYGSNGTAPLPDGVDIKLGVNDTSRAAVKIAIGNYWSVSGHLVAGSGGDFTGYLSSLTVGQKVGGGGDAGSTGRLDIRNMDSILLSVSGNTIIGDSGGSTLLGYGYVHLGPGTATFNNLTIGDTWGLGLLDLYGTDTTVNGTLTLNATGTINLNNGATLTLNSNSNQNPAGVINGNGSLVKNGTGILTLAGAHGYTGSTTVNQGTLAMSHATSTNLIAASSVITVAAGATLDVSGLSQGFELAAGQTLKGSGTVTGDTTIALGATLAPGASPGVLDFDNSNLTIDGTYVVDIGAYSDPNAPATFSQTINIADLVLGEDSSLQANNWLSSWDRYSTGTWYPILQYTGSLDGTFASLSGVWDIDYAYSFDGGTWVAIQVPEPTSIALLGLAGLALLRRRR